MATDPHTLYLDTTEEITAVIDRLSNVSGDTVELVIPSDAAVLQSVVNLKLLARAAKRLGKALTITTRDETGQHLALQAGIGVRAQLGGPLLEARRVRQRAPQVATIQGTPEDAPDESAAAPTPVQRPPARRTTARATVVPAPAATARPPAARGMTTSTGRKLRSLRDTDDAAGAGRPPRAPGGNRIALLPNWPWKKVGIGAAVVLVLGFFVLTFPLASATIKVTPKQQQAALDGEVVVKPTADATKHEVTGRIAEQTRQGTRQVTPSGSKDTGTKAAGTVTISNVFSNTPQSFGVNTRLQSADSHVFLLTTQVTVPGATVVKGKAVAGTATATVAAEKFGEEFNVGPTTFALIDLPADQQAGITAKSDAAMSGGTKKTVKVLSQGDVDGAVKSIQDELAPQLTNEMRTQLTQGEELLDGAIATSTKKTTSSVAVDAETDASQVDVTTNVVVKGFVDKGADVDAVAAEALKAQTPANQSLLDSAPSTVTHTFKSVDFKQQTLILATHAARLAVYNVDPKAVADQAAGKTRSQAHDTIQAWPEVDKVEVQLAPFWRFHLPGNPSRVKVQIST
ncbi:MAG: hypothetical protein U0514_01860 [Candidatus Andersenbacteria bacterium]